jgi:hypothetical protein
MHKTAFTSNFLIPFLVISLLLPLKSVSQQSVSVAYNYGKIVPHSTEIKPLIEDPVRGFTVNYYMSNKKGEEWRIFFNQPNYGLSYNFKSYGNPEILGDSHSLNAFLQMSVLPKRKYFDLGFLASTGFGYFTKTYDPESNPTNKAISTHINIGAELRLFTKIRFDPFYLEYSMGLNHFSNGLIKAPNLGINVKNRSFTFGYEFEDQPVRWKVPEPEKNLEPRHEFWIYAATGLKEVKGMPNKYMPVNTALNYSYRTSIVNKMGFDVDFIYDPSLEDYATINYNYQGEPPLNFRYGISLHNEFIFGNTGLFTSYGFYPKISEYYTRQRYYKVGFKFYFKNVIGVVLLRAIPLFRADLLELGIGYRISAKGKK